MNENAEIKLRPSIERAGGKRTPLTPTNEGKSKLCYDLKEAVLASGLKDGMTISFHHCFREGDSVIGAVLNEIYNLGIRDLTFAPSAVVGLKDVPFIKYINEGMITHIEASGIRGNIGDALISGDINLPEPVILRPHGARPRAIREGKLNIDVAFIAVSASDEYGNCTGLIGKNPCGSLGYSFIDAAFASHVVAITDTLVDFPCIPASISQMYVDRVVKIDSIGDPKLIGVGATRLTRKPRDLQIAEMAADFIRATELYRENLSFQTGVGAISIACTHYLAKHLRADGIKASFALGGITASIIDMYDEGLVKNVLCSQAFDSIAASAVVSRPNVVEIDNEAYSGAYSSGSFLDKLNFGILGALEVDTDFNVNLLTGAKGEMNGGLGGGPDLAYGADVCIVTIPIIRGRIPSIVDKVLTVSVPGNTIACVITQAGIALNPRHKNFELLKRSMEKAGMAYTDISNLRNLSLELTGEPDPIINLGPVVAKVEYRDGTILDEIRKSPD